MARAGARRRIAKKAARCARAAVAAAGGVRTFCRVGPPQASVRGMLGGKAARGKAGRVAPDHSRFCPLLNLIMSTGFSLPRSKVIHWSVVDPGLECHSRPPPSTALAASYPAPAVLLELSACTQQRGGTGSAGWGMARRASIPARMGERRVGQRRRVAVCMRRGSSDARSPRSRFALRHGSFVWRGGNHRHARDARTWRAGHGARLRIDAVFLIMKARHSGLSESRKHSTVPAAPFLATRDNDWAPR